MGEVRKNAKCIAGILNTLSDMTFGRPYSISTKQIEELITYTPKVNDTDNTDYWYHVACIYKIIDSVCGTGGHRIDGSYFQRIMEYSLLFELDRNPNRKDNNGVIRSIGDICNALGLQKRKGGYYSVSAVVNADR